MTAFNQNIRGSTLTPDACARVRRNSSALATSQLMNLAALEPTSITGDTNLTEIVGQIVLIDGTANILYLPVAADLEEGAFVWIKNVDPVNSITVEPISSGSIDRVGGGVILGVFGVGMFLAATAPSDSNAEWWRII